MQEESASLYYKDARSDKEYHAQLVAVDGGFLVNFQYGKRGGTLTTGSKTAAPVDHAKAKKTYDALLKEKLGKGYTPGEAGTAYIGGSLEERFTGVVPQLLNPIGEEDVEQLLRDPNWVLQEKHDGHRRLTRRIAAEFCGINRKGLVTGLPQPVVLALSGSAVQPILLVDGELMGDLYAIFDVLEFDGVDLRGCPYAQRLDTLAVLQAQLGTATAAYVTYTARTESEKRALYAKLKEQGREGGVFKHLSAAYVAGRPNSGGNQLKRKFTHSASFRVQSLHATKRSVGLSLLDERGEWLEVGNCTVPSNYAIPPKDSIVEVEYLYAFKGGSVFQPQYKGERDDIELGDCTLAQIHFKAEVSEEDEG